jgi:sulfur-oxidizing protein SoxX
MPLVIFRRTSRTSAAIGMVALLWFVTLHAASGAVTDSGLPPYAVVRDTIPLPLTAQPGDPAAGKLVIEDRKLGNCLSCHAMALPDDDQGNIGPDLHAVGARLKPEQLRLRLVNMKLVDPLTIMPAYYRVDGLANVSKAFIGKPILTAQQIEDVVAFLAASKTPGASR